ncbi:DUF418 domain-containing protein [Exiguobacterium flavidum]|uniref:DUF418 domain-containing protein n=1 Tax=Exiguobacterium flavidum TaxID=2184695 RepID=UPI000DF847DA|nr:DUF418 domain-containing protein [Exiguobacterium flavidum]
MEATALNKRIAYLDVLRGFALCGILLVNMPTFIGEHRVLDMPEPDRYIRLVFDLFIQTKFYTLFSVLFGAGFYLFTARLKERGDSLVIFARRLLVLLLFGLLHLAFFWRGDILHTYALTGFLLLLFVRAGPKSLIFWAIVSQLYIALLQLSLLMMALSEGDSSIVSADSELARLNQERDLFGLLLHHIQVELPEALSGTAIIWPEMLSLFLVGAYLMRRFYLKPPSTRFLWVTFSASLALSLPSLAVIVMRHQDVATADGYINYVFVWLSGRTLAVTYAAMIAILLRSGLRLGAFASLGRMALTNYLAQTVVFTSFVFASGKFNEIPLWFGLLMCLIFLPIQAAFSRWYLARHAQGPFEAVWRRLTYGSQREVEKRKAN